MKYLGKEGNTIKIQCDHCNKTLKYSKNDFHTIADDYCIPSTEIKCDNCGESTRKIIYSKNYGSGESTQVRCPKCGSTQIQAMKRGWKLTTGLIGSSKIERVCLNCKNRF